MSATKPFTHDTLPQGIQAIYEEMLHMKTILQERHSSQIQDEILNIDETADFLNLQRQTIYTLVSQRKIPFMKQGKRLHFSRSDLTAWLKTSNKKTSSCMKEACTKKTPADDTGARQ
jgi:excisionase family DNA binding protein